MSFYLMKTLIDFLLFISIILALNRAKGFQTLFAASGSIFQPPPPKKKPCVGDFLSSEFAFGSLRDSQFQLGISE